MVFPQGFYCHSINIAATTEPPYYTKAAIIFPTKRNPEINITPLLEVYQKNKKPQYFFKPQ
jgi:hypothetical protein